MSDQGATVDQLAALAARVAALEQRAGAGADQLQTNVLTVNPDGTIGANLTGHLRAAGVDLTAQDTDPEGGPNAADAVRWLIADGTDIADAVAGEYTTAAGGGLLNTVRKFALQAFNAGSQPRRFAGAHLRVTDRDAVTQAAELGVDTGPSGASAGGQVGSHAFTLMSDAGVSDYAQLAQLLGHSFAGPWNLAGSASWSFNWPAAQSALIVFGGSGYAGAIGASTLDLYLDGAIAAQVPFYFNQANVHAYMGTAVYRAANLAAGAHTLAFNNGTPAGHPLSSDNQDRAFALVIPTT